MEHDPSKKTLIGVLASHDDAQPNASLLATFTHLYNRSHDRPLDNFHFVITGGTWDRLFYGVGGQLNLPPLATHVAAWLMDRATPLPGVTDGGVILLSYLVSQRQCSIVWPFYAPNAFHWLRHENLAFVRLCDHWHVKRLMNRGSVLMWFDNEAEVDRNRNLQTVPPLLSLTKSPKSVEVREFAPRDRLSPHKTTTKIRDLVKIEKSFGEMSIALIAHDDMKIRMTEFAVDHEAELQKFGTIYATGTTGREVAAATSSSIDSKMVRFHSGPKGGDIEIATHILKGLCDVVIFFVDTMHAHPHIDDIRVVFQACMIKDHVVMITNEMHAREFMSRVVRNNGGVNLYDYAAESP
jgi:methylglyoxal synthase